MVIPLLKVSIPAAALPVTMTSWPSLHLLIIVCLSGPFLKDKEIEPSISVCFTFLGISIPLMQCVTPRPLPHWLLAMNMGYSNYGLRSALLDTTWQYHHLITKWQYPNDLNFLYFCFSYCPLFTCPLLHYPWFRCKAFMRWCSTNNEIKIWLIHYNWKENRMQRH